MFDKILKHNDIMNVLHDEINDEIAIYRADNLGWPFNDRTAFGAFPSASYFSMTDCVGSLFWINRSVYEIAFSSGRRFMQLKC